MSIPKGKELYRGRKTLRSLIGNWYTLDIQSAKGYGDDIGKYETNEDLKFINVLSSVFHKDFKDKLTIEFPGYHNNGDDIEKMKLLTPLGLPDLCLQNIIANQITSNVHPIPTNEWYLSIWKTMNNVSRFSDYTLDDNFAKKIQQIYGSECDGFILPLRCPSIPLGGEFHEELYVNNISKITYISDVNPGMVGGGVSPKYPISFHHRFKSKEEHDECWKRIEKQWNDGISEYYASLRHPQRKSNINIQNDNIIKSFRKTRKKATS